jgi:hypothetical protein
VTYQSLVENPKAAQQLMDDLVTRDGAVIKDVDGRDVRFMTSSSRHEQTA